VAFEGGERDEFASTLFFKPPFGPYPKELKETFPIGPCEIPDWDDTMVRKGCEGIRVLMEKNRESRFTVSCPPRWNAIVREVLGNIEVRNDAV